MSSQINTGSINVNYPIAGVNNSTQGFRDNFAGIVTNLNTAGAEISDLENKGIFKSALTGTVLNNDMANAQISNALTLGFRSSSYNLGNNLANTILVDLTNGDVQYGTITANAQLQFAKWSPAGTQSRVELILNVANTNAVLNLPSTVTHGVNTINNYLGNGTQPGGNIAMPTGDAQVQYLFSSVDCGTNITIEPVNLPRQTQQIVKRIVTSQIGRAGDRAGDVCIGSGYSVGSINIITGGNSYTSGTTVTVGPPDVDGGRQATANITVTAGVVTSITVTNAGTGYMYPPTITINNGNAAGVGATANSTLIASPNNMYYCYNDYNGTSPIWAILSTQPWPLL